MTLIFFEKFMTSLTYSNCIDANIKFPRILDKTNTSVGKQYFSKVQLDSVPGSNVAHNSTLKSQSLPYQSYAFAILDSIINIHQHIWLN